MKTHFSTILLNFWLLLPAFTFAQEWQTNRYFQDTDRSIKTLSSRVLPSEVQKAYDVKWYFLNLNAENNSVALSGDVTIRAEVVNNIMDTFSFHLHQDYIIDSILINGAKKNVVNQEYERLVTGLNMTKSTLFDAQIFYHGRYGGTGGFFSAGICNATDKRWGSFPVTWTLSQPNNAYHWFPVKQDLTDKADSSWVFVTTTKPNMVASNGLLTNIVDLSENKVRYEWKSSYPIDYYLISMAVAEYQDYSIYATIPQTGKQLLIQNYIYNSPQCLSANKAAIDKTKDMIEFFSEIFGEYPFAREKYGHALALSGGGMEHQTMTTAGHLDSGLIAHELVHQWFGDNVTCASWQYVWLNEGFGTYGKYLWLEHKRGRDYASKIFKSEINYVIYYGQTGSVFVPIEYIDNENRIFDDVLTYEKGAILLHMIRYELGDNDELFFNILQTYQNRYKDNVATAEDFKNILEELSDIDFTTFFNQWYYGEGYPIFNIKWHQLGDKLTLNSTQTTTAPSVTPLFKVTYELNIIYNDNSNEIVPFYHDEVNKQFVYYIPNDKTIKSITFNPNSWLLASAAVTFDPNAIEDFSNVNGITVYPNPVTETINIKFDVSLQGNKDIYLFDVNGKLIQTIKTTNDFCTLNVCKLHSGTYFLSVKNGENIFVRKIVKR